MFSKRIEWLDKSNIQKNTKHSKTNRSEKNIEYKTNKELKEYNFAFCVVTDIVFLTQNIFLDGFY